MILAIYFYFLIEQLTSINHFISRVIYSLSHCFQLISWYKNLLVYFHQTLRESSRQKKKRTDTQIFICACSCVFVFACVYAYAFVHVRVNKDDYCSDLSTLLLRDVATCRWPLTSSWSLLHAPLIFALAAISASLCKRDRWAHPQYSSWIYKAVVILKNKTNKTKSLWAFIHPRDTSAEHFHKGSGRRDSVVNMDIRRWMALSTTAITVLDKSWETVGKVKSLAPGQRSPTL